MNPTPENVYIFIRKEGWYPLSCRDDEDAKRQAEANPGTIRVETMDERVIWRSDH